MNVDLIQLRWQCVRATEASQMYQQENIALRQELADLRANCHNEKQEIVTLFARRSHDHILRLKNELCETKKFYITEVENLAKMMQPLVTIANSYEAQLLKLTLMEKKSFKTIEQLCAELAEMKIKLANSNSNLEDEAENKSNNYDKLH
jgi:hypothetical protein